MKNKLLFTAILFVIATNTFSQVPNYVPTNGLVGYWPFNGNAIDESVNANDGTVNGATLTTDRFVNINAAYNFNGTSDFISVMDNSSLDLLTNQYTLSVWFKIPDYSPCPSIPDGSGVTDGSRTLISKPRNAGWANGSIVITYNPDFPYDTTLATGSWNVAAVSSNTIPPINTWTNVIATYNGSLMSIYIDGVLKNTISATGLLYQSSEDLYFGKAFNLVGNNWYRWFKGQLDDIGIWNRALTQCEIQDLYNSQLGSANTSSTLTQTALDSLTLNGQTYTQSGTYTQVIPNAAGCDSTITLNLSLSFTGITELKDGIRIYPNPTFDNLTIERTSSLNSEYVLVDSQGRLVLQGELTETIKHISLGKLEYGNYLLQLENQSVPIRIVKQ
jgi:hypothetical protein